MRTTAGLAALLLSITALPAAAACTWEWLCNGDGACKHMPICDSVHETPPPRPEARPPIVPPLGMRPHTIAGQMGPLTCEHIMRKGKTGRWYWHEACYCTDARRNPDTKPPFANIVQCEKPWKE